MVTRAERLIYEQVLLRDRYMTLLFEGGTSFEAFLSNDPWICVAPIIDPNQLERCSGEMERDHVWEHAGGTKGVRPPTTLDTVVILCSYHHRDSGWATSHRPEIRGYIRSANERYKQFVSGGTI